MEIRKKLMLTTKEALASILPITGIVFLLSIVMAPMNAGTILLFIIGALLLAVGMGLFTLGAEMALMPIGEDVGIKMTRTKRLLIVAAVSFAMGTIITFAEPDLQVLAQLVPGVPNFLLIVTIASGVGFYLVVGVFRTIFNISLSHILIISYGATFVLSAFVPPNMLAVAFDSGAVTTGSITVPFIMAMGLGLTHIRGDKESLDDSFGLVALGSVGPILATMVFGIIYKPEISEHIQPTVPFVETTRDAAFLFLKGMPVETAQIVMSVLPILAVLLLFQIITRRYSLRQMLRILVGFVYTFLGLALFMTGVNVGFIPVGQSLGSEIGWSDLSWTLVPIGGLIGFFVVAAEPAVQVLKKQVEEVSFGAIRGSSVMLYLAIGVSVSLALSMLRVISGISIYWFMIPGYAIALVLTFVVPKIFTGIAFDSGGIAAGSMATTFLLPFAIGACRDPSRIMMDAYGVIAMIGMTPIIAIQFMGLIYKGRVAKLAEPVIAGGYDEIIEFDGYYITEEAG